MYLPADELAADGVDRELLIWCHAHRRTDPRVRRALIAQHEIARQTYRFAAEGIATLAATIATVRGDRGRAVFGDLGLHRKKRLRGVRSAAPPSARRDGFGSPVRD